MQEAHSAPGVLLLTLFLMAIVPAACYTSPQQSDQPPIPVVESAIATTEIDPAATDTALFAGGCFWCMTGAFLPADGVHEVISGFAGGDVPNPTYEQVVRGDTGHAEVVQVIYDPEVVSYEELLTIYWRNIDPHSLDGQFCDRGSQYRPEIFALDDTQHAAAVASRDSVSALLDVEVTVPISGPAPFYAAEDYHQDYFLKNADRYNRYRQGCGQDDRLEEVWGEAPSH